MFRHAFPQRLFGRLAAALPAVLLAAVAWHPGAVHAASAIATAPGERATAYYWVTDQPNIATAKSEVLRRCTAAASEDGHRGGCRLGDSGDGPAYWAVVVANNGGLGWKRAAGRQEAIDGAYRDCVRQSRGRCAASAAAVWFDGALADGSVVAADAYAATLPLPAEPSGQWTRLRASADLQFHVDRATLRRQGDTVIAWVLYSMADESSANLNEHQCKSGQYRTLRWKHYAAALGKGGATASNEAEPWRSPADDPFYADIMQTLCRPTGGKP